MLKKTISYTDYNGVEQKEEHYFNFNKAEMMDMQMSFHGGFAQKVESIIKAKNDEEIYALFKDIILKSYGVKSEDGKRFVKSDELRKAFEQSEAFSELIFELCTNANSASEFVNGIIPFDMKRLMAN